MCGHVAFVNSGSYLGGSLTLFLLEVWQSGHNAPALKTGDLKGSGGSNPSLTASLIVIERDTSKFMVFCSALFRLFFRFNLGS